MRNLVKEDKVKLLTPYLIDSIIGNDCVESITLKNFETNEIDYWWGNFHQTFEGMQQGNEAWEEPEAMDARSALEEVSTCGNPDLYNSQTIYDPLNPKLS